MSTDFFEVNGLKVANIKSDSNIAFFGAVALAGSNYETPEIAGISHYCEHMFFKGTKNCNWQDITEEFAKLGASNNAYTSNSEVLYHATVPKDNVFNVIELIMDLLFNSVFPEEEIEKERNVIIEEKKMYDDNPKSSFYESMFEEFCSWDKGHPIIGTFDTIKSIQKSDMIKYLEDKINLSNLIFICSGDVDSKDLASCISDNLPTSHPFLSKGNPNKIGDNLWSDSIHSNNENKIQLQIERKNITQSTVAMPICNVSKLDPNSCAHTVLFKALGGGMFSKLFARIREELGLCYSVGISNVTLSYPNYSVPLLYGYTDDTNIDLFIDESEKVLSDVAKNGIDENLFECAKTSYLSAFLRGTETSAGKAMNMVNEYMDGQYCNIDDVANKIRKVDLKTVNGLSNELLGQYHPWAVMIPKK